MITKQELLELLEDAEDDEQITFVIDSKYYTNVIEKVRVIDREQRSDWLIHKTYIDLSK
jgi:hypothetical protein